MLCPNCSSENEPTVRFCTRCGTALAPPAATAPPPVAGAPMPGAPGPGPAPGAGNLRDTLLGVVPIAIAGLGLIWFLGAMLGGGDFYRLWHDLKLFLIVGLVEGGLLILLAVHCRNTVLKIIAIAVVSLHLLMQLLWGFRVIQPMF